LLVLFTSAGCPACAAARPEFEKFKTRNPFMLAVECDADGPYRERFGLKRIQATPLYVFQIGDEGVTHTGMMKADQIEKWIKGLQ
jgi:thioredoxin-like negative regulator of GroEL